MKKVLNFSHPLTETAVEELERLMDDKVRVVEIPVQIDTGQSIKPQIDSLVEMAEAEYPFDALVPPGLAMVAGALCARLSYAQSDAMMPSPPPIVAVVRVDGLPPQFLPTEIMRW